MKTLSTFRTMFFFLSATSACFADNGVKRHISAPARVLTGIFAVLFVVAEVAELILL